MILTRKISETILEFGNYLIEELPKNSTKEQFEHVMRIVVSAWNAVVLDEWNKTNYFESEFLKALSSTPEEMQLKARSLIARKKTKYPSDPRAVGNYWVLEKNGKFVFRAEARIDLKGLEADGEKH